MITSFIRTLILYFLIIFSLRIMGKRQLGELQPSELVTSILISDLAAVPMQDLGIPLVQGVVPILTLFGLEMLISALTAGSVRLRDFFSGRTSVLVKDGRINQRALAEQRISVTELLEELRLKDVFDPREISCAYLETNGMLSVQLKSGKRSVTAEQMGADTEGTPELYTTLIAQGHLLSVNLPVCGRDEAWLRQELAANGYKSPKEIYLMVVDNLGSAMIVPKERFDRRSGVREG